MEDGGEPEREMPPPPRPGGDGGGDVLVGAAHRWRRYVCPCSPLSICAIRGWGGWMTVWCQQVPGLELEQPLESPPDGLASESDLLPI